MNGFRRLRSQHLTVAAALIVALALAAPAASQGKRAVTFQDLMKFRSIQQPVISADGRVVAYGTQPDRGDGEGFIHVLATGKVINVPRGTQPSISKNGRWVAMTVRPAFAATEKAGRERPRNGMALVNVETGTVTNFENVDRFSFSDDSRWLAFHLAHPNPRRNPASRRAKSPARRSTNRQVTPPRRPRSGGPAER